MKRQKSVNESEDTRKYQVEFHGTVPGQIISDYNPVHDFHLGDKAKASSSTKPERVWNVPFLRNRFFTGHEGILEQLYARFQTSYTMAFSPPQAPIHLT